MNIKNILIVTILFLSFFSCKKDNINPENIFTKIYNDDNSDLSYYPLDIVQSGDGGYYILSALSNDTIRTFLNTHISKTDNLGELIWESTISEPYVNPITSLISSGSNVYFLCMDRISLGSYLMRIDETNGSAEIVNSYPDIVYPLASSQTPDNGILLLSYDRISRSSLLTKFNSSFEKSWDNSFPVIEDAEEMLVAHLTRSGKTLPFFTGTIGNGDAYFANALFNYSLALLFVDANNGDRTGLILGDRYNGGMSAMVSIQASNFAVSRFVYDYHYILPSTTLSVSSIISASDLGGEKAAELAEDAHTRIIKMNIDNRNLIVYASNTNSNQILLLFYDLSTGELVTKKYLGHTNPVKVASLIQTADSGLAVLAQTMVAGRFKRNALYKIPKEQILE
ncbi:MAG: hypothetical protein DRI95_12935 [Bacteroidetes bacterium]|nr:MAG: hypothetical protein DRI95_12935 [Bacteroidota bacterium]